MFQNVITGNLFASHTMPDFVTPMILMLYAFAGLPLLVCAAWGAGPFGLPFRIRKVLRAAFAAFCGVIVVALFIIPVIQLVMRAGLVGGGIAATLASVAGGYVAFWTGRRGRAPKSPPVADSPNLSAADEDNPYVPRR